MENSRGELWPAHCRGKFSGRALACILSGEILGESFGQHTFMENSRGELRPAYFRGKFSGRASASLLSLHFRGQFSGRALTSILSWEILDRTFVENSRGEPWPHTFVEHSRGELPPAREILGDSFHQHTFAENYW